LTAPDRWLPNEFSDLEPFAATWCLATENERYAVRLASSIGELTELYNAFTPRCEAVIEYCDQFPLDAMPEEVVNLMRLTYSFITASFAVECWVQPRVPDTGASNIESLVQPVP
jgi:hypothetical protein